MPERRLRDATFAFLDTETTGFSPQHGGRVCELAVLSVKDGQHQGMFHTLINPEGPISEGSRRVHGITDAMVADSPTFSQVADKVRELLADKVMVCHNAQFDVRFMTYEFEMAGLSMPDIPVLDTLALARKHFKFHRNGLAHIAECLDVSTEGLHRADNDVTILDGIFKHFLKELSGKGAETVGDLLELQTRRKK